MNGDLLSQTDDRGVCTITLNRPDKHNAFNVALMDELRFVLKAVNDNQKIRIVVLTGAGKSFCSGADLEWMKASVHFNERANRNV